jgi:hypothetical protein
MTRHRFHRPLLLAFAACFLMACNCEGFGDETCEPESCESLGRNCGPVDDGCGTTLQCGTCESPESCGGGTEAGVCAVPTGCIPRTCAQAGADCGVVADGCGGYVECGTCTGGLNCGGDGTPNVCGEGICEARSCADQGFDCGYAGDGCGDILDCGTCQSPETCGGGGTPSVCGDPDDGGCQRLSCQAQGMECGLGGDGCGGIIDCGSCPGFDDICGGDGQPSVCYIVETSEEPECEGLCEHQVACPAGGATTLTGTVFAPNGHTPLYNAQVFVPQAALPAIPEGASCDRCDDQDLGDPLVWTVSASDGTFTLRHVPAEVDFPLVVQVGKWRRQVTISAREPCSTTALDASDTRLPKNQAEGHIPRIAISTGSVDGLECVLYKAGVDLAEFSRPTANGRIHLYRANGAWGDAELLSTCGSCSTHSSFGCGASPICNENLATRLYENQTVLNGYDIAIFGCEASQQNRASGDQQRLLSYVDDGGRLFVSHWAFDWIYDVHPLSTTAQWGGPALSGLTDPTLAWVDDGFVRGLAFSEWLDHVDASTAPSEIRIYEPRTHAQSVTGEGRRWVYTTNADHGRDSIQQFTFNTPVGVGEDNVCGRVAYSAFHVTIGNTGSSAFPNHCTGDLTPQENVLLFMLFDLAACVIDDDTEPPAPITCEPRSCLDAGAECGPVADGCGDIVDCGPCPDGQRCGAGGPYQCGEACVPRTCEEAAAECGSVDDGCGGTMECGTCEFPAQCIQNECHEIG